jgi:uncharacterized protein
MSDHFSGTAIQHADELRRLVVGDVRLMQLLRLVASLGLSQWCVAAGAVRNIVWDRLHGFSEPTVSTDVDVLIFDSVRTEREYERQVEASLVSLDASVQWEVVNQATVHTYTGDPAPYHSIAEAMSRWVDPMTAVGVNLDRDGFVGIVAPLGLEDLFSMVVRPHLVAPRAAQIYRERVATKNWSARWPKVRVMPVLSAEEYDSSRA